MLLSWNGQPINEAIDHVSTLFGGTSATTENLEIKKAPYLVRAPVGTDIQLSYKTPDSSLTESVSLVADDDHGLSLSINYPVDSQNGIGGVSPDIRLPMTAQNTVRIANGEDVELDEAIKAMHKKLNNQ
ncbi:hypothetical protein [Acetobacterium sp.]|uniref:hypothetical protein n=1 Tax=Acetobacterium sp. TaxID=1872094 RepID=UPI003593C686